MFWRRTKYELTQPNVMDGWHEASEWHSWDPPRNVIAGESHYQAALRKVAAAKKPRDAGYLVPVEVWLVREPRNKHDRNAFAAKVDGELVGYLRREVAAQLAPAVDKARCERFAVCGVMRGGTPRAPSIGCHVWLERLRSPGPTMSYRDGTWIVPWPPWDGEGEA